MKCKEEGVDCVRFIYQLENPSIMGRIKTKLIKRTTVNLYKNHGAEFKEDFKENKELVAKYLDISSNKLKNIVTGYITRLVKIKKEF